ncbi:hypothetical protein [Armatimonas rosea]|uniref:Uncharacterized protein n=1 Tax=Armatimonas rosea TaxID=685828 RepID=A0A7W9W8J0_ARMRO|nr:hypothetical protein [Armatimonas rosea]MBB6052200.1 hypothetical protein [Armatimonas rosea]
MNYTEYEVGLIGWLKDASDEHCRRFGLDLLDRTYEKTQPNLPKESLTLIARIVTKVKDAPIEHLSALYFNLVDEVDRLYDEVVNFEDCDDSQFSQLRDVVAGWVGYRETGARNNLTGMGVAFLTLFDWELDGDWNSSEILA